MHLATRSAFSAVLLLIFTDISSDTLWRTFEEADTCLGEVMWMAPIERHGNRPVFPWRTPCPVMQEGTVEFDCLFSRMRYKQKAWFPGDWIHPVAGSVDGERFRKACMERLDRLSWLI